MKRTLFFVVAVAASLGSVRLAAADAPDFSFPPECVQEIEHRCPQCASYGHENNESHAVYQKCVDEATAQGLVESCHRQRGAKFIAFYCPREVIAQRDAARSRGCSGCSLADGTPSAGLMGLAIGALALGRRRGRRASSRIVVKPV